MGLNAYFATVCALGYGKLSWQQGLAGVLLSGVIYIVLTVTGLRFMLFKAVPQSLRHAITAGIGLFLAVIAFKIGQVGFARLHATSALPDMYNS